MGASGASSTASHSGGFVFLALTVRLHACSGAFSPRLQGPLEVLTAGFWCMTKCHASKNSSPLEGNKNILLYFLQTILKFGFSVRFLIRLEFVVIVLCMHRGEDRLFSPVESQFPQTDFTISCTHPLPTASFLPSLATFLPSLVCSSVFGLHTSQSSHCSFVETLDTW